MGRVGEGLRKETVSRGVGGGLSHTFIRDVFIPRAVLDPGKRKSLNTLQLNLGHFLSPLAVVRPCVILLMFHFPVCKKEIILVPLGFLLVIKN